MAEQGAQERTEQATPRKQQKARQEGQIAQSPEIGSVAVLGAAAFAFWVFGQMTANTLTALMHTVWIRAFEIDLAEIANRNGAILALALVARLAGPYMATFALVGLAASVAQVGWNISGKALQPKLEKLDLIKGAGRLVSKRAGMELLKSIAKIAILAGIGYWTISERLAALPPAANASLGLFLRLTWDLISTLFLRVLTALLLLAIIDYAFQRWQTADDLKMTRQEIRDEMKETDGDPQVKGRIRRLQQEMARRRMLQAVPDADVVVANPTHFAVALKYAGGDEPAPRVVAKGADLVAQRIKEIASDAGVPVIEDPPTARALYRLTDIGAFIPQELYGAVAEILALVYRRRQASRG
jgi:flagellar biosynthetic protein FlhB